MQQCQRSFRIVFGSLGFGRVLATMTVTSSTATSARQIVFRFVFIIFLPWGFAVAEDALWAKLVSDGYLVLIAPDGPSERVSASGNDGNDTGAPP